MASSYSDDPSAYDGGGYRDHPAIDPPDDDDDHEDDDVYRPHTQHDLLSDDPPVAPPPPSSFPSPDGYITSSEGGGGGSTLGTVDIGDMSLGDGSSSARSAVLEMSTSPRMGLWASIGGGRKQQQQQQRPYSDDPDAAIKATAAGGGYRDDDDGGEVEEGGVFADGADPTLATHASRGRIDKKTLKSAGLGFVMGAMVLLLVMLLTKNGDGGGGVERLGAPDSSKIPTVGGGGEIPSNQGGSDGGGGDGGGAVGGDEDIFWVSGANSGKDGDGDGKNQQEGKTDTHGDGESSFNNVHYDDTQDVNDAQDHTFQNEHVVDTQDVNQAHNDDPEGRPISGYDEAHDTLAPNNGSDGGASNGNGEGEDTGGSATAKVQVPTGGEGTAGVGSDGSTGNGGQADGSGGTATTEGQATTAGGAGGDQAAGTQASGSTTATEGQATSAGGSMATEGQATTAGGGTAAKGQATTAGGGTATEGQATTAGGGTAAEGQATTAGGGTAAEGQATTAGGNAATTSTAVEASSPAAEGQAENGGGGNDDAAATTTAAVQTAAAAPPPAPPAAPATPPVIDMSIPFCNQCRYKNLGMACVQRVQYLVQHYRITEEEAQQSEMEKGHCPETRNSNYAPVVTVLGNFDDCRPRPRDAEGPAHLDNFCRHCQWKGKDFSCHKRVNYLVGMYGNTHEEAMLSLMEQGHCTVPLGEEAKRLEEKGLGDWCGGCKFHTTLCEDYAFSLSHNGKFADLDATKLDMLENGACKAPPYCEGGEAEAAATTTTGTATEGAVAPAPSPAEAAGSDPAAAAGEEPGCVLVITGSNGGNAGNIDVSVDAGDGYVPASTPGKFYKQGEVVLDACYDALVGVRVRNPTTNAWVGSVEFSRDEKVTYVPFTCGEDECQGSTRTTDPITVDGNDDGGNDFTANCLNGDECTLTTMTASEGGNA